MSDVQATPAAVAVPAEETVPTPSTEAAPVTTTAAKADEPVVAPVAETAPATVAAAEAAPATSAVAEEPKAAQPVNEGLLGYKAPGLLKQFTFSKKDFWFSDEAVAPEKLHSYLRGEKAEVAHPVAAYASQTGKGLLFFGKKGDSDKTKPEGVLPLYEATELKKSGSNEFSFRLQNQSHSFKAATDAEAEGWYQAIEKSIELGKAQKESVVESEGYKAELEKLGSPAKPAGGPVAAITAAAAGTGAAAVATNHTETNGVEGAKRTSDDEVAAKDSKSRSRSRGFVARLRRRIDSNLDEHEAHQEQKDAADVQRKADKLEDERIVEEREAIRDSPAETPGLERPKASKRNSSFFSGLSAPFRSTPVKEKDAKEAELKDVTEEPAVSAAAVPAETTAAAAPAETTVAVPSETTTAPVTAETAKKEESTSRRTSVFGGLGRRASNMISRLSSSKDVHSGAAETAPTENALAPAVTDDLAAHEATEPVTTTAATTEAKAAETEAATTTTTTATATATDDTPKVVATPFGTSVNGNATA